MADKTLNQLALPLIASFTFRFAFTLIDLVFAAEIKDEVPFGVAAIGLFIPIQSLFIAIWVGLSAGFTATISQAIGRRDQARVAALKAAMVRIHLALVPLMLLLALGNWWITRARDLDPGLAADFLTYSTILIVTMPFSGFLSIYPDSIVKAHHDTVSTMKAGIASTVANVVLNTVFVFVFHWGIAGLALATALSRYAGLAYAAVRARALERERLSADAWPARAGAWGRGPLADILVLAIPGSLAFVLQFGEEATVTTLLTGLEDEAVFLAAFAVFNRLNSLAIMPAVATAVALLPYVARRMAEARVAEVRADLRRSLLQSAVLVALIAVPIGWLFAAPLAAFLVPGDAAEAGADAARYLALMPLGALFVLPAIQLRPVFEAVSRPRAGVRMAMCKSLGLVIPLSVAGYFAGERLGVDPLMGILVGMTTAWLLASLLTMAVSRALLADPPATVTQPGAESA